MTKQKTLNGKNAPELKEILQHIDESLDYIRENTDIIRTQTTVATFASPQKNWQVTHSQEAKPQPIEQLPPSAQDLPIEIIPYVKKESETAYKITDDSILDENGRLDPQVYGDLRRNGWAFSPAKKLIWKPKQPREEEPK